MISPSQRPLPDNTQHSQHTNIQALGGIRTHDRSRRAAVDLCLRPRGHWDRQWCAIDEINLLYFLPLSYHSADQSQLSSLQFCLSLHEVACFRVSWTDTLTPALFEIAFTRFVRFSEYTETSSNRINGLTFVIQTAWVYHEAGTEMD